MGSISDLVNFKMLQPLQGATVKPLETIRMPNIEDTSTPDPGTVGLQAGANMINNAILQKEKPPAPVETVTTDEALPVTSDETLKINVEPAHQKVDEFLNQLGVHQYEYKNPQRDGLGTHFSVMAQELEKAGPVGKSMVIDTPEGKKVDYSRGLAVYLTALAKHNDDIKQINKTLDHLKKSIKQKKS